MMEHPQTLKQFQDATAREVAAENGVSIAEAMYGISSWDSDWKDQCEQYAKDGSVFRKGWLNACDPDWRYCLRKWYPESIPAGYVDPACVAA